VWRALGRARMIPAMSNEQRAPHRGGMILAFGILGLVFCAIFGVAAWVMGNGDLRAMDEGRMDPAGRDLTRTGKILGIVGACIQVAALLAWLAIAVVFVAGSPVSR
jgi:hypothetical protein